MTHPPDNRLPQAVSTTRQRLKDAAVNFGLGLLLGIVPSSLYCLFSNQPFDQSLTFVLVMGLLFGVLSGLFGRPMLKFLLNFLRI